MTGVVTRYIANGLPAALCVNSRSIPFRSAEPCFVVGGFLFAYLLLAGKLIPRWMAWIGVITIGLQLICVPLYVATLLPGKVINWLWFPILFYELPLGVWLIRKGTSTAFQD